MGEASASSASSTGINAPGGNITEGSRTELYFILGAIAVLGAFLCIAFKKGWHK